jgi:threonine/homoserine/homoserine lactone efflux protein
LLFQLDLYRTCLEAVPHLTSKRLDSARIRLDSLTRLFALMGWCSDSVWALLAGTVAEQLRRRVRLRRAQRNLAGGTLIALGVASAFSGTKSK